MLGDIVGAGGREGIVVLDRVHRYGAGIAELAQAIRRGDGDAAVAALGGVTWIEDRGRRRSTRCAAAAGRGGAAARDARPRRGAGDAREAIEALGAFRLLCAHRRGPHGVSGWTARDRGAGSADEARRAAWYVGRPLLVTENDYGLRLYNGDTGVRDRGRRRAGQRRVRAPAARSSSSAPRGSPPSTPCTR